VCCKAAARAGFRSFLPRIAPSTKPYLDAAAQFLNALILRFFFFRFLPDSESSANSPKPAIPCCADKLGYNLLKISLQYQMYLRFNH
jgi:hypothetical protein